MRVKKQTLSNTPLPKWGQAACLCLLIAAQSALGNPSGGKVTQGSAIINTTGTTTTIEQSSNKAVINWNSFSINPNETTQFIQPSSKSFTLNRVIGGNASHILGNLKANGTIYIINQNGILFGKNAVVNVGGLVASTSNISDKQFMKNGAQTFTQSPSGASIINEGKITVKDSGIAVLVSPTVVNDGVISANLGTVALASGDRFTLDLYGDNLIAFDAGKAMTNEILSNSGAIQANGGQVMLTAQAADALVSNTINMTGIIEAQSVSTKNGKVILQGYDNSTVNVSGKIDVSGKKTGERGGLVQVTADTVNLKSTSKIDASGDAGGGTVNIGGEYQGKGQLATADFVNMDSGASITASALQKGNGGIVTLWADENTNAYGSIYAQGGVVSGNGGLIETSSPNTLDFTGININASAPNGVSGSWLLDPLFVTINDADASTFSTTLNNGTDVSVWASNNLIFNNTLIDIAWSTNATFSARADFNQTGSVLNTITMNPGADIVAASGTVNFYYNPMNFGDGDSFLSVTAATFNPYMLVNSETQLQAINTDAMTRSGYYALNRDIDASGILNFTPIGDALNPFTGKFTGAVTQSDPVSPSTTAPLTQYTISNLTSNHASDYVGLFGFVTGDLDNIHLDNANISGQAAVGAIAGGTNGSNFTGSFSLTNSIVTGDGNNFGGLFGIAINGTGNTTMSTDSNTTVTAVGVGATSYTGGLIGYLEATSWFSNATNNATVIGSPSGTYVGGLYGYSGTSGTSAGTLINTGDVTGTNFTGGIAGQLAADLSGDMSNFGEINGFNFVGGLVADSNGFTFSGDALNEGAVTGRSQVGGYMGRSQNNTLGSFTNSGTITGNGSGTADFIGGAFGVANNLTLNSTISNSGNVLASTSDYVGGIAGSIGIVSTPTGALSNSGDVSGNFFVGGLAGQNLNVGNPLSWSNSGSVTGNDTVGGIAGENIGFITNASNTGNITGGSFAGGIAGFNSGVISSVTVRNATISGSGASNVGGAVGGTTAFGVLSQASVTNTTVSGTAGSNIGGLIGNNQGTIDNVYFQGSVSGDTNVGGIVGLNEGPVGYTFAQGAVSGNSRVGALMGENTFSGSLANSFFNTSVTGSLSSVGLGTVGAGVIGSTAFASTNPLSQLSTFTNNGFSAVTWQSISGYYPSLTFCGVSCASLLPINPTSNVIETQLVNGTLTNIPVPTQSTDLLVITPGSEVIDFTELNPDEAEFADGIEVLSITDPEATFDADYVKTAVTETVEALQKARGCAVR